MEQIQTKRQKREYKRYLVAFLLAFTLIFGASRPIFAEVRDYVDGLDGTTAFQYRSLDLIASAPLDDNAGNVNRLSYYAWTDINISSTTSLPYLNMKFLANSGETGEPFEPRYNYCNFNTISPLFQLYFFDQPANNTQTLTFNNYVMRANPVSGGVPNYDGSCSFHIQYKNGSIPSGDYLMVLFGSGGEFSFQDENGAIDPTTGHEIYRSMLGSNRTPNAIINTFTNTLFNNNGMTYYKDGSYPSMSITRPSFMQPDFYFVDILNLTDPNPPVDPPTINSCNPFADSISTAFLNINFSIVDCFTDLGTLLFIPSAGVFTPFSELMDEIKQKPPFGWIVGTFSTLGDITGTSNSPAFTLQELEPISNAIFDPIRTAFNWLLYFTFAFYLFNRFKNLTI